MKKILIIFFFISSLVCGSQTRPGSIKANPVKSTDPRDAKSTTSRRTYSSTTVNSNTSIYDTLNHSTCVDKQFSVVIYVVLDSSTGSNYPGIGYATATNLAQMMTELNNTFRPICVSFTNCSTVLIPNFNYGKTWVKPVTEPHVTGTYYTDKTINLFIVDTVLNGIIGTNIELMGYTYEPSAVNLATPKKDLLVITNQAFMGNNFALPKHMLGHYFGLPHTFDEINSSIPVTPMPPGSTSLTATPSLEFVDGSNCYLHGDGFCDTEADSGDPLSYPQDGMGNYYIFPFDNLMSYYDSRCRFTQEQYNWMARTIMSKRLYLH